MPVSLSRPTDRETFSVGSRQGEEGANTVALLKLTPNQIWDTDLDRFLEEWEVGLTLAS